MRKRIITLKWNEWMDSLGVLPEPNRHEMERVRAAEELLHRILTQDIPISYLLDVTRDVFDTAWTVLDMERTDVLRAQAQMQIDESLWEELMQDCLRLVSVCDPWIGDEFL